MLLERHVIKLYGLSFLCAGLLAVSFFWSKPSHEPHKLLTSDGGSELCSFLLVRLAGCYRGNMHARLVVCIIAIWVLHRQRRKHSALDPAGVVENKLCSLSLACPAKADMVSWGPAVVGCAALGVAYTLTGTPSSSCPSSSMFNIGAEYLLSLSISSSTLSCSWALNSAAWSSCLLLIPESFHASLRSVINHLLALCFGASPKLCKPLLVRPGRVWNLWFALCSTSRATLLIAFFNLAFASLSAFLRFKTAPA